MPELPEVETIRQGLEKYLVGKKIIGVKLKGFILPPSQLSHLEGGRTVAVKRFGKGLVIDLNNKYSLAIHIKLTGQFIYKGLETENITPSKKLVGLVPSKFTRIIFKLDKNAFLYFNDVRKFAWVKVVKTDEVKNLPFFKGLGPEPFRDLRFEHFKRVVQKSKGAVKAVLMDQKKIGGVGNIYANDALNLARVDPRRKGSGLDNKEIEKLYETIHEVLKRGLKYGGATELNYVNALGQSGKYQEHFLTYGRQGQKCYNCGGTIKKIFLAGRGTYFCEDCQDRKSVV